MKTLNHDAEDRRSYGWDGAAFTVTIPTPSDIKRLDEINRAYDQRQAEIEAQHGPDLDEAFEIIARHYPQAA